MAFDCNSLILAFIIDIIFILLILVWDNMMDILEMLGQRKGQERHPFLLLD